MQFWASADLLGDGSLQNVEDLEVSARATVEQPSGLLLIRAVSTALAIALLANKNDGFFGKPVAV